MSSGSAKRFSIEIPGARPRRARDRLVEAGNIPERGAIRPAPLSSIHYLRSGGWVKRNKKLDA